MNQVKAGAILNYVTIVLNTILGLVYTPYMLRMLGQNEYGLYSLVASVIAYLTVLDFGFGNAIIRYTAKFRAEGKRQELWEMFGMFTVVYVCIGVIAMLIGLGLYFNVDRLFDTTMTAADIAQARTMMALLTVNLALTFPLSIFGSIITAYEDFVFQKIVSIIRLLLCTATIVGLLYVGYKAVAMVVVQTVFNIATLLINFLYCRYKIRIKIIFARFNRVFFKEVSIYSFWIFLNAIMDRIYWGTGQFVLGMLCGTVAVAIFSVAILLQQLYMSFSTAIASVLLPRITAMITKGASDKEVSDIFIRTGRIQYIIIAYVLAGFAVFGGDFISLWAGADYDGSFAITLIFFVALMPPLIQNVGISILQARNQMKFRSLLYLFISLGSLACQFLLTPRFEVLGCAWAIGGALLLGQGLIMNVYYHNKQHIDIPTFWRQIAGMTIVPAILVVLSFLAKPYISTGSWGSLCGWIAVFSAIYLPLFVATSTNSYEKHLIFKPFKRFLPARMSGGN